jgi:hypothetical protein
MLIILCGHAVQISLGVVTLFEKIYDGEPILTVEEDVCGNPTLC